MGRASKKGIYFVNTLITVNLLVSLKSSHTIFSSSFIFLCCLMSEV